jgi:hypothetical protein
MTSTTPDIKINEHTIMMIQIITKLVLDFFSTVVVGAEGLGSEGLGAEGLGAEGLGSPDWLINLHC